MEVPVFNKERAKFYSFNEVYLEAPKKATKVAGDSPAKQNEVPVQKAEIPPNVLEYAKKNDIIIRDVNKKNYNK